MKSLACLLFAGLFCQLVFAQEKTTISVNNKITLQFKLTETGVPQYAVLFDGKKVIGPSRLGFQLNGNVSLDSNFILLKTETKKTTATWQPVWGEVSSILNQYQQLTVQLQQKNAPGYLLTIVFKVYDEGVGFRYEFPLQPNLKFFVVSKEITTFGLAGDHTAFWIPGDYDSNEYLYTTSKLSEVDAWKFSTSSGGGLQNNNPDQYTIQTPLMMKSADGLYINIHEAALVNYPAMQLHVNRDNYQLSCNLVPDAVGNKAYLRTPANTPWRTIIVSDKATDILASKMILNLNEPTAIKNTSWIKPMKFVGVWWEMQTGKAAGTIRIILIH